MVSSSNRLAPVLEVAHVLRSTLVALRVPTVRAVTARRGDGRNAASALLCWTGFGEIAQEDEVSMSAAPKRHITAKEYLALERQAAFKSEFYRGEMFAMAGA